MSRPLLAARSSSGEQSKDGHNGSASPNRPPGSGGPSRPKRTLIESACSACRRRKSRCDGVRPTCSRCQNLRTDCHYEAEEGESRWSALRRRNQILEHERDQLRDLLQFVQTRPESEAHEIFLRIRQSTYDELLTLSHQIKDGTAMNAPPLPTASSGPEQRLPPIQAILDPTASVLTPVGLQHSHSLSSEDSRASSNPDIASAPPLAHQHRHIFDTLEPSLRGDSTVRLALGTPQLVSAPTASLSSEESVSSISSTSVEAQQKPYYIP